jgi:hypothetical protein
VDLSINITDLPIRINGLLFVTEAECVYCAVRTQSLNFKGQYGVISVPSSFWLSFTVNLLVSFLR